MLFRSVAATESPDLLTAWTDPSGQAKIGRSGGPLDWNDNKDLTDTGLSIDLNANNSTVPTCDGSGPFGDDQALTGADDWEYLNTFGVRIDPGRAITASDAAPVELTGEQYEQIVKFCNTSLTPDVTVPLNAPKSGSTSASLGLAMDSGRVYATQFYQTTATPPVSSQPGSLVVLNRQTMQVDTRIPVGFNPSAVAVNDITGRIYVFNRDPKGPNVSVIDRASMTVVATINTGVGGSDIAVNSKLNRIYVANAGSRTIQVIDGATNTLLAPIAVPPGGTSLAVDEANNSIYVAHNNRSFQPFVTALGTVIDDGQTSTVLPLVDLGVAGTQPIDVTFDATHDRIYVAGLGGGGTAANVIALDRTTRTILKRIDLTGPARGIAVNSNANQVIVAGEGGIQLIDGATFEVKRTIAAKTGGLAFAVTTENGSDPLFYVGDLKSGDIRRFSHTSGDPT